jgi:hypothetical protein
MYKKDLYRIEDNIIPFVLEGLLMSQIKQEPKFEEPYKKALSILRESYIQDLNTPKLLRRAERIERKLLKFWSDNNCIIRKSIMVLSHLIAALDKENALSLKPEIEILFQEINTIITNAYDDNNILKQDQSAAKQTPKILAILQDEGLF